MSTTVLVSIDGGARAWSASDLEALRAIPGVVSASPSATNPSVIECVVPYESPTENSVAREIARTIPNTPVKWSQRITSGEVYIKLAGGA
jgi:hypothetical protein